MWSVVIIECDESRIFAHPVKTLILYLCLENRYFGYGFRCDGTYIVLLYPIHVMTIAIYTLKKLFFSSFICFVFIQLDLQFYVISLIFKIFISSMIHVKLSSLKLTLF